MRNWFRSPTLLKLFVGQHIVNGLSVAISVIAVALAAAVMFGFSVGQVATLGAISASISDFPAAWRVKARILIVGFCFALLATTVMQLAGGWTLAAVVAIGLIAFAAGMVTGYGRWALSLSAQFLVPMVLVLGVPRSNLAGALHVEAIFALGGFAYIALALAATQLTGAGDRRLMASECFRELATYLRAIARFTDPEIDVNEVYGAAVRQQAALSEQLQAARGILLDHPRRTAERVRLAATIGLLLDVFDALIAAQCDLLQLRDIPAAKTLLSRVGVAVRASALDLQHLSLELLRTSRPGLPLGHVLATDAMRREAARVVAVGEATGAEAAAIEATTVRLLYAREQIRRLESALCDDRAAQEAIGGIDLSAFEPRRSYNPRLLAAHLTMNSPVFRFAVRLSAAMMAGAVVAVSLGWVAHGNWVLLTTAVIMRASYGWTRKRRDDRIVGTLIGCVIASVAVPNLPIGGLVFLLGFALALTHGFVRSNYRVASVGASVMALVSLYLSNPAESAPMVTRLADTLIGAAIAHLFSHVLPLWESTEAPRLVAGLLSQIRGFAEVALRRDARDQNYRLARRGLNEAIAALSDSAARMGGEPRATRRGLDEMAAMLIAAHVVATHISALRLDLRVSEGDAVKAGQAQVEADAARRWLVKTLADFDANDPPVLAGDVRPPPALLKATLALLAAARAYRRVCERA
ncbi:MAG TPA: FUSC family membrane protein [Roseiarcus sp.]|jgi:uncharacterized membrane protein YccC